MTEHVSLADLDVTDDPGTAWHPRPDKTQARDADGNLLDLDDDEVAEHTSKPEAAEQVDAVTYPLAAEDSTESPDWQV